MPKTIDELLIAHPNLHGAVMILIEGCKGSNAGHKALYQWDQLRREEGPPTKGESNEIH